MEAPRVKELSSARAFLEERYVGSDLKELQPARDDPTLLQHTGHRPLIARYLTTRDGRALRVMRTLTRARL
jgi:hypothetical protein